jgi:DNA polymerase-1
VLQIHDELLIESPPEEVADVERIVATEMSEAMKLLVPVEVSVHSGGTWAECE